MNPDIWHIIKEWDIGDIVSELPIETDQEKRYIEFHYLKDTRNIKELPLQGSRLITVCFMRISNGWVRIR